MTEEKGAKESARGNKTILGQAPPAAPPKKAPPKKKAKKPSSKARAAGPPAAPSSVASGDSMELDEIEWETMDEPVPSKVPPPAKKGVAPPAKKSAPPPRGATPPAKKNAKSTKTTPGLGEVSKKPGDRSKAPPPRSSAGAGPPSRSGAKSGPGTPFPVDATQKIKEVPEATPSPAPSRPVAPRKRPPPGMHEGTLEAPPGSVSEPGLEVPPDPDAPPPPTASTPGAPTPSPARSRSGLGPVGGSFSPVPLQLKTLSEVCHEELALAKEPARRARLHYELGVTSSDDAAAARQFAAALEANATHIPSIRGARTIAKRKGDLKRESELYEAEIDIVGLRREKAALALHKGIAHFEGGQAEKGREAWADAYAFDPEWPTAIRAHAHGELPAGNWSELEEVYGRMAGAAIGDPTYRAAVTAQRARWLEARLERDDEAAEHYRSALDLDAETPGATAALRRIFRRRERWLELVAVLELEAKLTQDIDAQAQAYREMGQVQRDRLRLLPEAALSLEEAVKRAGDDVRLLHQLADVYRQLGDVAREAGTVERLVEKSQAEERLAALERLGRLYLANDEDRAIRYFAAALQQAPAHPVILPLLERLYTTRAMHDALASALERAGDAEVDEAERAAYWARAGQVHETHLKQTEEGVAAYQKALILDRHHAGAFKALVRLYTASKRWRDLVELYDRAVDHAVHRDIAEAYLFKIGSLYEDVIGDMGAAASTFERILKASPEHLGAIHALQRAAEASGDLPRLLAALDREVELTENGPRRHAIELRAAEVAADALHDEEEAARRLEALQKRATKHLPTLTALSRIYDELGQADKVRQIQERRLAITEAPEMRCELLLSLGRLAEDALGAPKKAIEYYREAVEVDPHHTGAGAALSRLLRGEGRFEELAAVFEAQLERAKGPDHVAHLGTELGELYELRLGKPKQAVAAYRRALTGRSGFRAALAGLVRVFSNEKQWDELVSVLQLLPGVVTEPRLRRDAVFQAAGVEWDRLGRAERATELWLHLLEDDERDLATSVALEAVCAANGDRHRLAEVLLQQGEATGDREARIGALMQRARLVRSEGDDAGLRAACTAILAADPKHQWALEALEDLALRTQDTHLLSEVDSRFCDVLEDAERAAMHRKRLADVLRSRNPSAALRAYRDAADQEQPMLSPIRGLLELGYAMRDGAIMVEAYQREANWRRADRAAADLLVQAAVQQSQGGAHEAAVGDLEHALRRDPDHEDAAAGLVALMLPMGREEDLIHILTQAAHAADRPPRRVSLWRDIGRLLAERKRDLGAAISAVTRAHEIDGKDVATVLLLADLVARDKQHTEASRLLSRAVELEPKAIEAHLQLARIHTDSLPDSDKAKASLRQVLAVRPADRDALSLMLRWHLREGRTEAARETGEKLLESASDEGTRAWALSEIGRMELEHGDRERAAEALREAVVIEGPRGPVADLYRSLVGSEESLDRYIQTLEAHVARRPDRRVEVQLEIAQSLVRAKRPDDAMARLKAAMHGEEEKPGIALAFAGLALDRGRLEEARTTFHRVTTVRPGMGEAWHGLVRTLQAIGRPAEAALAAGALVALGDATVPEKNLARERMPRPGLARPGSFAHPTIRSLSSSSEDDERIAELLRAHGDGLAKAFPPDFDSYGVRRSDRLKPRTNHPIRKEVDRLAQVFGLEEFDLYVHAGLGGDVAVELTETPSLFVPTYLSDLPEAARVFLLSRGLAAITGGLHAVLKLGAGDLATVVAAAVRRSVAGFEDGEHAPDKLGPLEQLLAPSWFGRGRVEEVVQRYYAEPVDVRQWARQTRQTLTRIAALVASDLAGVAEGLRQAGHLQGEVETDPTMLDLLAFWFSTRAHEARKLGGII